MRTWPKHHGICAKRTARRGRRSINVRLTRTSKCQRDAVSSSSSYFNTPPTSAGATFLSERPRCLLYRRVSQPRSLHLSLPVVEMGNPASLAVTQHDITTIIIIVSQQKRHQLRGRTQKQTAGITQTPETRPPQTLIGSQEVIGSGVVDLLKAQ